MSSFLTLDSLSLTTPDGTPLFDGLTLSLGRERIGLVGRNGCGKSTLLRAIAGDVEPARGSLSVHGRLGRLAQIADEAQTISETLGAADGLARLARLAVGEGSLEDADLADWTLESRLESVLASTGLRDMPLDTRLSRLSGGERTRVMIARLLLEQPDILLLDEPTNNLDTDGRHAIANLLAQWRGGALIASHDRKLLEHMDRIVELSPIGVTVFGGGWSDFREARDAARAQAEADLARSQTALRRTQADAQRAKEKQDRRDKAGRTARAKGDAPKMLLDKRQVLTADPRDAVLSLKQIAITFPQGTSQDRANERVQEFASAIGTIRGCGDANRVAESVGASVVDNDSITVRDLPPQLQASLMDLQVGQTTPPFGSMEDGVRVLLLCGRDDPEASGEPDFDQIMDRIEEERISKRAQRFLRDLRDDAIIEYN